jgi:hypothetical protein
MDNQDKRIAELEAALEKAEGIVADLRKQNDYWTGVVRGHAMLAELDRVRGERDETERDLLQRESDFEAMRNVSFERGPDGEPNGPCLGDYLDIKTDRDDARSERDTALAELKEAEGEILEYGELAQSDQAKIQAVESERDAAQASLKEAEGLLPQI